MGDFGTYHWAATLNRTKHSQFSLKNIIDLKSEMLVAHLYHVDDVVRQPEEAKNHHDGQDEFLAADRSAKLGLSEASQDEDVARDDDRVRQDKPQHRLKGILKPFLHRRKQNRYSNCNNRMCFYRQDWIRPNKRSIPFIYLICIEHTCIFLKFWFMKK